MRFAHARSTSITIAALVLSFAVAPGASALGAEEHFALPSSDFKIMQIAASSEAHNIFCMTLDAKGRVVVSGPGYIRTLIDTDGDGYLETAREFYSDLPSGAMGLLADEGGLYFVGGRGLERLEDDDGDGRADGPPRLVLPLEAGGEHNAHAVRRGADGFLYLVTGNYGGFKHEQICGGLSPVIDPYAGVLIRLSPSGDNIAVLAHGLRNTYDFDFDARGELIGWDSDGERDVGLPWYRGCRLYHLSVGADGGWRSSGSGKLPIHAVDVARPIVDAGRGSPTGVVVYRHRQFPHRYRDGVFIADWTFGRVLFVSLKKGEATYDGRLEDFLQSSPKTPFAPCDLEVAPDGSLLVASGGRGLAGAVYRVTFERRVAAEHQHSPLDRVLRAPSPLDAWSRARWTPVVKTIPTERFLDAIRDSTRPIDERVRALDVLFEQRPDAARDALRVLCERRVNAPPRLRARAAWWSGRTGNLSAVRVYLKDPDPWVLRVAIEGCVPFLDGDTRRELSRELFRHANHPARRVRQSLAAVLAHVPRAELPAASHRREVLVRGLSSVLQAPWGQLPVAALEDAERALDLALRDALSISPAAKEDTLDALRLLELVFERLQQKRNPRAVFYEDWDAIALDPWRERIETLAPLVVAAAHGSDRTLRRYATRILALLAVESEAAADTVLAQIDLSSSPGEDILTLSYLGRLPPQSLADRLDRLADALLALSWKFRAGRDGRDRRWHRFVATVAGRLFERQPGLSRQLVADGRFGEPDHVTLVGVMAADDRSRAIVSFLSRPTPATSDERRSLLGLFAEFPDASRVRLREFADDAEFRSLALSGLAKRPTEAERQLFLDALSDSDRNLVGTAVLGLQRLPRPELNSQEFSEEAVGLLRWGYVLDRDEAHLTTRDLIAAELERLTGEGSGYQKGGKDSPQRAAFDAWADLLRARSTDLSEQIETLVAERKSDEERVREVIASAPWTEGDARAGAKAFEKFACHTCHHVGGRGHALGPDLSGLGTRFSVEEMVTAIGLPNRDVPPRYRADILVLGSGEQVHGRAVYDSREALLFQSREGRFIRLRSDEIVQRIRTSQSLMPTGYLETMSLREVADLVAFLRSGRAVKTP